MLKLIKTGAKIWSINNQMNFILERDVIMEITHTTSISEYVVFGKPMQLLFNIPGYIPTLIGCGTDEWSFNLEGSEDYVVPPPQFYEMVYTDLK